MHIEITHHAAIRMDQRAIGRTVVELVHAYGADLPAARGRRARTLMRNEIAELAGDGISYELLRRAEGAKLILDGDMLVTVYRTDPGTISRRPRGTAGARRSCGGRSSGRGGARRRMRQARR